MVGLRMHFFRASVYNPALIVLYSCVSAIVERLYVLFLLEIQVYDDSDSVHKSLVGNVLYPVSAEFKFNPPILYLAISLGFFVGGLFWGFSTDIWGRRYVYSLPLILHDNLLWSF